MGDDYRDEQPPAWLERAGKLTGIILGGIIVAAVGLALVTLVLLCLAYVILWLWTRLPF